MTDETERLREALASANQLAAAQAQRLREQDLALSGIQALQAVNDPATLITEAFTLLSKALDFDRAMFLEQRGDVFQCIAATDSAVVGARWQAGAFFRRVSIGRAAVTPDESRLPEWADASVTRPLKGAIYAPIAADGKPGLLVLASARHGAYSAGDLAMVSRLSIFVSQTLAAAQRRRLAEAAQRADSERRQAVEANEAKSQFLANMSHEIRTPLNGVNTVAALLAGSGLSGRQLEMAELILESGQALERLLNDVLDLAKIESGRVSIDPTPFDVAASLGPTFELFGIRAEERGLSFNVQIAPEANGLFVGDAGRFRQVAANLLSNAVKFTQSGGVTVSLGLEEGHLVLQVRDTGVGFDAATAARLFTRFEQADSSVTRQFGGTGLGLALSRSLATMMGGEILCESTPGKGSVFIFRHPAVRAKSRAPEADGPMKGFQPEPLCGPSILVAEDNPNNRKIVGMVLDLVDARTIFVEDGEQAVAAFAAQPFDAVLMDLQMPVMDGLAATRMIRAREKTLALPPTPIIALSANAMVHHVEAALAAGASAHVAKPIDPQALIQALQTLIEGAGGGEEAFPIRAGKT